MADFYVTQDSWLPRIAELCRADGTPGLDIECFTKPEFKDYKKAGLDPWMNGIRSIQLATAEHSWFIDLFKVQDIEPIKKLISDPRVTFVIHNASFENKNLIHHLDVYPEKVFDTLISSRLFQYVQDFSVKHGLQYVVARYLDKTIGKEEQVSDWAAGDLSQSQIEYGQRDARVARELYCVLKPKLEEAGMMRSAQIEFDATLPIAEMELYGLAVDLDVIKYIQGHMETRLAALERTLAALLPNKIQGLFEAEPINVKSPDQLIPALLKHAGIKVESTEALELVKHRKNNPGLIDALLDYSSLSHNLSTYCQPILKHIHPVTKRLHPKYGQLRQWQHRATISKPNMNLPRPNSFGPGVKDPIFARNFFCEKSFRQSIIPEPGNLFSIVDFSQNQSRIVADSFIADEPKMKEEFALGEKSDIYRKVAAEILGKTKDQVSAEERQRAKTWVLAFLFGAGAKRFAEQKLVDTRTTSSMRQCEAERTRFFEVFNKLEAWHRKAPIEAKENGYIESSIGRKIWLTEELCSLNRSVNFPVCATEVDGAKLAGGRLSRELRRRKLKVRPAIFVYDEWVLQGPEPDIREAHEIQKKIMLDSMNEVLRDVPAAVEGGIGKSWAAK